ncbi:MAG: peptidylprolyl isomerase [Chromatiales bacterium]|jgi:FKBP-type peptidyl-prolyl cis-trans isomerase SlyD|nr:peptidylprolyl isomerase [Chromatiales bacterium]MDX9766005.1 peptidylprolyl isomerase [Ectothiorhodospiraceae bacterium]
MRIAKDTVVTFEYTLTDTEGSVIDSSQGGSPFSYLHGASNIIPGLESALEGHAAGDSLQVTIEPEHAYGLRDDELIQAINREQFQGVEELEIGMQFHSGGPDARVVTVTGIEGDTVTIDGNHPLAGVTLNFDVTVVNVRGASTEELDHGHVHD